MGGAETKPGKSAQGNNDLLSFSRTAPNSTPTRTRKGGVFPDVSLSTKPRNMEVRLSWMSQLTNRITHVVNEVLTQNKSLLDAPNINPGKINSSLTLEAIVDKEKKERDSQPNYLYRALIDSGVSEKLADTLFSSIGESDSIPMYWAKKEEPIFIPGKETEALAKEDLASEVTVGLLLGMEIIERTIQKLPAPAELNKKDWTEVAKNNIDTFFQDIMKGYRQGDPDFTNLDPAKLDLHKKSIISMLDHEDTHFIALGAEVHVVFPGQALENSDFSFGSTLNQGIITKMAAPLEMSFSRKLANMENRMTKPEHEENAEQILKALCSNNLPEYTMLVKIFLESKIPSLFMSYRKDRIETIKSKLKGRSKEHIVGTIFTYLFNEDPDKTTGLNVNVYPE